MKIIPQSHTIIFPSTQADADALVERIADIARTCYQSAARAGKRERDEALILSCIQHGHESIIEHGSISVRLVTDRAVSHELVRHRIASYAQESQRYCDYEKDKFGGEITFIRPSGIPEDDELDDIWRHALWCAGRAYALLRENGVPPETARSVLPNATKTEIVVTASPREWRHIFELRVLGRTGKPHPDIRALFAPVLEELSDMMPVLFKDLREEYEHEHT